MVPYYGTIIKTFVTVIAIAIQTITKTLVTWRYVIMSGHLKLFSTVMHSVQ